MYITINDVKGEKTIDLSYPIHLRKEVQSMPQAEARRPLATAPWRDPVGEAPLGGPQKSRLLACLAMMFSIGYRSP